VFLCMLFWVLFCAWKEVNTDKPAPYETEASHEAFKRPAYAAPQGGGVPQDGASAVHHSPCAVRSCHPPSGRKASGRVTRRRSFLAALCSEA